MIIIIMGCKIDLPSSKLSRSESSARVYEFQEDSAIGIRI